MARDPVSRDSVAHIHALLRALLPRRLRDAHAAEMEHVFRERLEGERRRRGLRGAALAWIREAWDLAGTGVRLRTSSRRARRQGGGDMSGWADDLRSALRSLRRSPGFTAFAVGTLALGIGATIAFASFFNRVVLHPVDFPGSDRVVMAWKWREARKLMVSPDLETRNRIRNADVFSSVAAVGRRDVAWSTDDGPRMLSAGLMDAALPALAGLHPVLGRYFDARDLAGSGGPVMLLSEGFWKRAFGGDPGVLGRSLRIEGKARTVVGVVPDALQPPGPGDGVVDVWLPLPEDGSVAGLEVFARLRDGATLEHAREETKALDLAASEADKSAWATRLVPVAKMVTSNLVSPLKVAGVAVALLLLIACINVANLLLARGDARMRETAVRAAVGAGRLRLARETLFESALIAGAASVVGLGLAAGAVNVVRAVHPREWTLLSSVHLHPVVTAAAVLCAVTTVLVFGTVPLVHRVRTHPGEVLTERSGTAGRNSIAVRRLFLAGEVALSFALLAGGVQVVGTLARVEARDPGLAVHQLLAVNVKLPDWRFSDAVSKEAALGRIRDEIARLPGVRGVTLATGAPPHTGIFVGPAQAEGYSHDDSARGPGFFFGNQVSPGYFRTVGQRLVEGRTFTRADVDAEPAPFILSESAAKKYFPRGDAVRGRFRMSPSGPWHPVIGVVRDVWASGAATDPGYPQLYMLRSQGEGSAILVRTANPSKLAAAVRQAILSVDREIPILSVQPLATLYRQALARERLIAILLAAFALTAAMLASVGLYGVVSQLAIRRTREFGIRISLGAERYTIFALAMRGGVLPVGLGLVVGAGLAWAGIRLLKTGVAGLSAADPVAFLGAGLLLALATLIATGVPAVRAARTDAIDALRVE